MHNLSYASPSRFLSLVAASSAFALGALALGQATAPSASDTSPKVINVQFAETLGDTAAHIAEASGRQIQFVVPDYARDEQVGEISLRGVTPSRAVDVLLELIRPIGLGADIVPVNDAEDALIVRIHNQPQAEDGQDTEEVVRCYAISRALSATVPVLRGTDEDKAEQLEAWEVSQLAIRQSQARLAAAIQDALEFAGMHCKLKVHVESGLLFAQGTEAAQDLIESVVTAAHASGAAQGVSARTAPGSVEASAPLAARAAEALAADRAAQVRQEIEQSQPGPDRWLRQVR